MKTRRFVAVTVGVMVLSSGLMLMNVNRGAQAAPPANNPGNPFQAILDKLDQVLAAITGAAGQGNHTLRWDTHHASDVRFTTAFPGAVLDKNTGLVWEQAPDGTPHKWIGATRHCVNQNVGGTVGWRLPSVVELKSVQDGSPGAGEPFVPASAFTLSTSNSTPGVQSTSYWSASTDGERSTLAWYVSFFNGIVQVLNKSDSFPAWCVRGGMNADQY